MDELQAAAVEATGSIQAAATLEALDAIRVAWLGKQGKLTEQLKLLGKQRAAALELRQSGTALAVVCQQAHQLAVRGLVPRVELGLAKGGGQRLARLTAALVVGCQLAKRVQHLAL